MYLKPINFKEAYIQIAKNQPEYITLPAHYDANKGIMTHCWKVNILERIKMLFKGTVWLRQMTFGDKLQPMMVMTHKPEMCTNVKNENK